VSESSQPAAAASNGHSLANVLGRPDRTFIAVVICAIMLGCAFGKIDQTHAIEALGLVLTGHYALT
jgi:hypothetical protein